MKKFCFSLLLVFPILVFGQLRNADVYKLPEMGKENIRENINIPGFDGYEVLKCDFHIHTVFSDGRVWPDMRVNEAWQQGLDAIAITDHIEYRPFKDMVIGDLNESYKIAKAHADYLGFIVIKGAEVTREKPIGHLNALFINDANKLDQEDPVDALREAKKQGAFIMWNHPGWPDDKSTLYSIHEQLLKDKVIDGVECFNFLEYYPIAFDYANKYNLAYMGNSDIYNLVTETYGGEKLARPITLVFSSERSEEGVKEALFARRTAILFNGVLAGKEDILRRLFLASVHLRMIENNSGYTELCNTSDLNYILLINNFQYNLPANKTIRLQLPKEGKIIVGNCYTGKDSKLEFKIRVDRKLIHYEIVWEKIAPIGDSNKFVYRS